MEPEIRNGSLHAADVDEELFSGGSVDRRARAGGREGDVLLRAVEEGQHLLGNDLGREHLGAVPLPVEDD